MSGNRIKVIRGKAWSSRLKGQLIAADSDTAGWLEDNACILKSDVHSLAGLLNIAGEACFAKLYYHKSPLQQALFSVGRGRPVRSFDAALKLNDRGVAVALPRACLLVPQGMLLLTRAIDARGNLAELWGAGLPHADALHLMRATADALAQMHCQGYAHGDCKWNNMLWAGDSVYLVDLDGARESALNSRRQARDVARFTLNAEELGVGESVYEQFLARYLEGVDTRRAELVARVIPLLRNLRAKHLKRYGRSAQALL